MGARINLPTFLTGPKETLRIDHKGPVYQQQVDIVYSQHHETIVYTMQCACKSQWSTVHTHTATQGQFWHWGGE